MKSFHYSHLSSSKVDARHCLDRLLCSSISTDICFFILYFLPFWRSYTLRWGRTDFHTQLAESKQLQHQIIAAQLGSINDIISLSLPSFFWFNTSSLTTESSNSHNKKRLKSVSWQDVCRASQSGSLRPSWRRTCRALSSVTPPDEEAYFLSSLCAASAQVYSDY